MTDKPFINVICPDVESWETVLDKVFHDERYRFSMPDKYVQELLDSCGRPLYMMTEVADFHIYPPRHQ